MAAGIALQSAELLLRSLQLLTQHLVGTPQLGILGLCFQLLCSLGLQLLFQLENVGVQAEEHARACPSLLTVPGRGPARKLGVSGETGMGPWAQTGVYLSLPQPGALQLLLTTLQLQVQAAPLLLPGEVLRRTRAPEPPPVPQRRHAEGVWRGEVETAGKGTV